MDGPEAFAMRKEYWSLVLETINRYVEAGHELSLETVRLDDTVRVSFCFQREAFADHFAHMGADVTAAEVRKKQA